MNELQVKLNNFHVGTIHIKEKAEIYRFEYTDAWGKSGYMISPSPNLSQNYLFRSNQEIFRKFTS